MRTSSLFFLGSIALVTTIACGGSEAEPALVADASSFTEAGTGGVLGSEGATDASSPGEDARLDAAARLDADADAQVDASLPPQLAACASCMAMTCQPEVTECTSDPTCVALLECTVQSGCLQMGEEPTACVTACGTQLGLTKLQTAAQVVKLTAIATTCAACLGGCVPGDGGAPDAN